MAEKRIPRVLAIAGSDSGGGAGIQADLKAFAAARAHGMCAVTAITAQNTVGVRAVHAVPPEIIVAQVEAVLDDIGVDAVKIGMLGNEETIVAVERALGLLPDGVPVVLDPVMVAASGAALLEPGARRELVGRLLPLASVVTPNLPEARALSELGEEATQPELAAAVRALGPAAVVVTGGHGDGVDVLDDGAPEPLLLGGPMHSGGAAHGSGCTHSSTLAALLGSGIALRDAAPIARERAGRAVADGLRQIGAGPGPVDVLGLTAAGDE